MPKGEERRVKKSQEIQNTNKQKKELKLKKIKQRKKGK